MRSILRSGLFTLGVALPSIVLWVLCALAISRPWEPVPEPSIKTPNPKQAPMYMMSLSEMLVYADPRVAPFVGFLLLPGVAATAAAAIWAIRVRPQTLPLAVIALGCGMLLAGPYYYALLKIVFD